MTWYNNKKYLSKTQKRALNIFSILFIFPLACRFANIIYRNDEIIPIDISFIFFIFISINALALFQYTVFVYLWSLLLLTVGLLLIGTYDYHLIQPAVGAIWVLMSICIIYIARNAHSKRHDNN